MLLQNTPMSYSTFYLQITKSMSVKFMCETLLQSYQTSFFILAGKQAIVTRHMGHSLDTPSVVAPSS